MNADVRDRRRLRIWPAMLLAVVILFGAGLPPTGQAAPARRLAARRELGNHQP